MIYIIFYIPISNSAKRSSAALPKRRTIKAGMMNLILKIISAYFIEFGVNRQIKTPFFRTNGRFEQNLAYKYYCEKSALQFINLYLIY